MSVPVLDVRGLAFTLLDPEVDAVQGLVAVGVGEREPPYVEHRDAHR